MATAETIDLEKLRQQIKSIGKREKVPFTGVKPKKEDFPDNESYQKAYRHYRYKMRYDNDPEYAEKCRLSALYRLRMKKELAKTATNPVDGARAE